jgi:hypothetical protein
MNHLWLSYYKMAGRIFSLMQCDPADHKGLEIILKESIPRAASKKTFWNAFMSATRMNMEIDYEADIISSHAMRFIKKNPDARIGIWGIQGRSYRFLKKTPALRKNIVWITDKAKQLHGDTIDYTNLPISPPTTIGNANLDCLIIGTRRKFIKEIVREVSDKLPSSAFFISIDGVQQNIGNQSS